MFNLLNFLLFVSVLSILTGCPYDGPYRFSGPIGTYQFSGPGAFEDFTKTGNSCLQQTKIQTSGAYVNQYGGVVSSNVKPSCSKFDACLKANGYYRNPNGNLDGSSFARDCT